MIIKEKKLCKKFRKRLKIHVNRFAIKKALKINSKDNLAV